MTDEPLNWPKKGDRAFSASFPSTNDPRVEAFIMPSDGAYVVGFQRAADMVVDAARTDVRTPDDLFYPVAYLYRHHLELMLKELIRLGVRLTLTEPCEDWLTKEHNLHKLWNRAKRIIEQAWPDSPNKDVQAVEALVQEISAFDPTGQALRYARDKHTGALHLQSAPERVDLANLKLRVGAVSNFLDAAYAGIDALG